MSAAQSVIRIKPNYYIHILDNNTNVTKVVCGPKTFTRQEHEKIVSGPDAMIIVPPRHYCIIADPVLRDEEGNISTEPSNGQVHLKYGDEEIRFAQEPFPLYPGERLVGKVTPLQVVAPNTALKLRAIRDFVDENTKETREAGQEWLFPGPGTYVPRREVQVVEVIRAFVVKPNEALKLRAKKATTDSLGKPRTTGEEWLIKKPGSYMPGVDEEYVETVKAFVLTEKRALHLRATKTFTDIFGKQRKAGQEWLVTLADAETYIPNVYEQVVGEVHLTSLSSRQYVVILDPWIKGKQHFGKRVLRKGEDAFFLQPGERFESEIQNVNVLGEEEALLLKAREDFKDGEVVRHAGDLWMVKGPIDYIPRIEVDVVEKRNTIALDENEGIYVRDRKTGHVRSVIGESYLLQPHEELWEKELPQTVEDILARYRNEGELRDKTRVVTLRAPHNSLVQVYNYTKKKSRIVLGPDLVMLQPDEQLTLVSLSGEVPKREGVIKSLWILLGPDFMADNVIVETSDHARLSLKLAYNWHFDVDKEDPKTWEPVFQVSDFVGDACKAIASRVRGAVAGVSFDKFHRNSSEVIKEAVFGPEHNNLQFPTNNLVITNVDVQSVEPVDQKTRDSLQKSVQLAIEITTKSQEATARHESTRLEQEAKGRLERQKIVDECNAESSRKKLIELQVESAAIESTGQAKAEAKARSEALLIEGEASVRQAKLRADALQIQTDSTMNEMKMKHEAEIEHLKQLYTLEVEKAKRFAEIELKKFEQVVEAISPETIRAMAEAGPATQAKLLQGLGLQSFLITDGNSPINLFNTAQGLIADPSQQQ